MAFKELCEENRRNEQEAKQRSLEADRRLGKLEKKFDRLGIQVGGIDDNQGHHAEQFFHEFDNYDVYLGIAGFSFSDEVLDRASTYGIGIIKQVGDGVEIKANNLKAY